MRLLQERLQHRACQPYAGHANIATTMRYIGLVQDEMRNAVESTTRTDMRLTMPMNQAVGTAGSVATYSLSTARIG